MPASHEVFSRVLGSLASGVTIVTASSESGPKGLTTTAVCSVSATPPLLLVCADTQSRTLSAIQRAGAFVINVLAAGREDLARLFASKATDKFATLTWQPSAKANGAPILTADIIACAECVLVQTITAGDHLILIGSVEGGTIVDGLPLVHFRRGYAEWPGASPPATSSEGLACRA
jgi:flavin-dependent trigonelline monooxygenase, reductase component